MLEGLVLQLDRVPVMEMPKVAERWKEGPGRASGWLREEPSVCREGRAGVLTDE